MAATTSDQTSTVAPRTKVLWLAKGLGQGGMERLLVTHAKLGDRQRFDYSAAYLVERPHSVIEELHDLGVPTRNIGRANSLDPRWVLDLLRMVRRDRIDVVHIHSPMPAAMARPVLRLFARRTRIVYTEHNRWDRFEPATRWANRLTFGLNHASFAVSEDCRQSMPPKTRSHVETLIHGVDLADVRSHSADRADARAELGVVDDSVVVGIVANFRKQKNYPLLLDVAAALTKDDPKLLFVSIGQGPLQDELESRHRELGLGERFRFLGFRNDVLRMMSALDVFCLSSDHEGLPVAVMEAKALGLPIVSTSVGGIPAAVTDGVDGLLVPPGDQAALASALARVAGDAELRRDLAQHSAESSDRYSATNAVDHLENVYRRG